MMQTFRKRPQYLETAWLGAGLLLLCFLLPGVVAAAGYYVSPAGDDANSGTLQHPFLTISKATDVMAPGDVVVVREGVYGETVEITTAGTPEAPIRFEAMANETVTIDATGRRHGFIIWHASHIAISGFTVKNSLRSGIHIHDHLDAEDHGADYNVIEKNHVQNCGSDGYNGIYVGGHHNRVCDNQVIRNGYNRSGSGPEGHGIYLLGSSNEICGNHIETSARVGIRMQGDHNRIFENTLRDNQDFGLTVWVDPPLSGKDLHLHHNILVNNHRGGISIYGQGKGKKPRQIHIYNNTVVNATADYGIRVIKGPRAVKLKNNIFQGSFQAARLYVDGKSKRNFEADYNLYHGTGEFYFCGHFYPNLAAYASASGHGRHSLEGYPMLNPDYTLRPHSMAVDSGTDVGLPFKGSAPDLGAKESGGTL